MNPEIRRASGQAARAFGYPEAHVLALAHVEGNGEAFATVDGRSDVPLVRFEGHIFFRRLKGEEKERAVKAGLAKATAGSVKNPKSQAARWARLIKPAMAINARVALESCSWGMFQVMGFHAVALGYKSVEEMFERSRTIDGQLEIMLRFIKVNGLDDELIAGAWTPLARGYNGPAYAKNRYDVRLREAAELYGAQVSGPAGMLRMGAKGKRVRELQALLLRTGAAVKVDGDFGPTTKAALQTFQRAEGITPDGIYGPETESRLSQQRQAANDEPGKQKFLDIDQVKKGGIGAIASAITVTQITEAKDGLEVAASKILATGIQSAILDHVANGLMAVGGLLGVAAVGYGVWGWVKSQRTVEA